jgi:uracil-DNA glycosylase
MDWKQIIREEQQKPYYQQLTSFLIEDGKKHTIYPPSKDVFNAFKSCPLDQVKVVILGQDCYHGPNQAHGLSFSVPATTPIPPSLRNIFKEIHTDLGIEHNFTHGNLEGWARQGVLLLNSVLTVRASEAGSHQKKGWETFTDTIIRAIVKTTQPKVFVLWGAFARNKKQLIDNPLHLVLEAAHPSPLSAHNGFFGCKHFSKTNEFLMKNGLQPIDWVSNLTQPFSENFRDPSLNEKSGLTTTKDDLK